VLITEYETERGKINSPHKIKQVRKKREPLGPYLTSMGYTIMEDPYVPLDKIDELLDWLYSNNVPVFGHIGIGVIHPRFKPDQKDMIYEMFGLVKRLGGDVSGEHGIGLAKKDYVDPSRIEHLTMLKNKYDPNNVLNRGKLI
jgi:FAD/FMN-containing dehydrogenase